MASLSGKSRARKGRNQTLATSIQEVLEELNISSTSWWDKGDKFERLIAAYLRTDPSWSSRFGQVWLWNDWPGRAGKPDTGIDLVAQERETGDLAAIQCKFYDPSHSLQKSDIDSFFTASGKSGFSSRLIVSTTDKWTKHAEDALRGQQIPVTRLRVQDLDESSVDWSQFSLDAPEVMKRKDKKDLRLHQKLALTMVREGFLSHARGKLIMACGTGKTLTSLRIAEDLVPTGGSVLVLVPSISLLSQTLKEWTAEAKVPLRPFAVCSDTKVGNRSDNEDISPYDLVFPATTDTAKLYTQITGGGPKGKITVVFSTYQSLPVVAEAQRKGLPEFDLVICDEAHRTTGVTLAGQSESNFVKVHDQQYVKAARRLYMTATPRLYDDSSKSQAEDGSAVLASMDDEALYGPEFHRLGFGKAVEQGLLTDYKVLILTIDEGVVAKTLQEGFSGEGSELALDDAAKIIGCWNAMAKRTGTFADGSGFAEGEEPMKRAVAFARSIADSKQIAERFNDIVDAYDGADDDVLRCEVDHVDGTFNALTRNTKLDWLKQDPGPATARILSNVRCLSEGVDVPNLDAVLFLHPRNSVVDVVQSVGRVMRLTPGKKYGYIILPVAIPAGMSPEKALVDNKRFKTVWEVLQALRAHDDRFNATVNQIDLNKNKPDNKIGIGRIGPTDESVGVRTAPAPPRATRPPRTRQPRALSTSRTRCSPSATGGMLSTPASSTRLASATTGRNGPRTLPRSPTATSPALRPLWRSPRRRPPSRSSSANCARTSTPVSARPRPLTCSPSTSSPSPSSTPCSRTTASPSTTPSPRPCSGCSTSSTTRAWTPRPSPWRASMPR